MQAGAVPAPAPAPGPEPEFGSSFFGMTSRDLSLTNILNEDVPSFALTAASRLHDVTGVPLSRFSILVANPSQDMTNPTMACVSVNSARQTSPENARYATLENTTFTCYGTSFVHGGSLLQKEGRRLQSLSVGTGHLRSRASIRAAGRVVQPAEPVSWDVGIFLPTHLAGDDEEAQQLATDMGAALAGDMMPRRELMPNGQWSQRPGLGYRFAALFPGTVDTEVQISLGPNPGGHGAVALPRTPAPMAGVTTPEPPPMGEAQMLTRAHAINGLAGASFYRLSGAVKAASRERYNILWGVDQPYAPFEPVPPNGALFPPWAGDTR